jgi:hypothetical protein
MKKLNTILHDEKVQGSLIVGTMLVLIVAVMFFTWGK